MTNRQFSSANIDFRTDLVALYRWNQHHIKSSNTSKRSLMNNKRRLGESNVKTPNQVVGRAHPAAINNITYITLISLEAPSQYVSRFRVLRTIDVRVVKFSYASAKALVNSLPDSTETVYVNKAYQQYLDIMNAPEKLRIIKTANKR